jgi:hypothetical protein
VEESLHLSIVMCWLSGILVFIRVSETLRNPSFLSLASSVRWLFEAPSCWTSCFVPSRGLYSFCGSCKTGTSFSTFNE